MKKTLYKVLAEKYNVVLENETPEDDSLFAGLNDFKWHEILNGGWPLSSLSPEDKKEFYSHFLNINFSGESNNTTEEYVNILKKVKPRGPLAYEIMMDKGELVSMPYNRNWAKGIKCYPFDLPTAFEKNILSTPTKKNILRLSGMGVIFTKVCVWLGYKPSEGETPRYSFIVVGTLNGKPILFCRREYASQLAGQTVIYTPKGIVPASYFLSDNGWDLETIKRQLKFID